MISRPSIPRTSSRKLRRAEECSYSGVEFQSVMKRRPSEMRYLVSDDTFYCMRVHRSVVSMYVGSAMTKHVYQLPPKFSSSRLGPEFPMHGVNDFMSSHGASHPGPSKVMDGTSLSEARHA